MRSGTRHGVVALVAGVLLCAPGCKLVRKWLSPAERVELGPGAAEISEMSQVNLSDPESRRGLEVRMLVVDDTGYDAPRMLNAMRALTIEQGEDQIASQIDEQTSERWARWGFRMVPVPLDRLDEALGSLTPVRPVSVQWLGEFGAWRSLIRAGSSEQTRVRVGESTRAIEPGRPRLIARSWAEPMLTPDGVRSVLRLDLGMQIEAKAKGTFALLPDQRARTLDDEGQVIDELLCSITLRGDHAIVIVGEAPGYSWDELPSPAPIEITAQPDDSIGPSEEAEDPQRPERRSPRPFEQGSDDPIGPRAPVMRSLGELMLVAPGSRSAREGESRNIPRRVLIVLVPSVRGQYQMLGPADPQGPGGAGGGS